MKKQKKYQKRVLNCIPSIGKEKDWTYENAVTANLASTKATLPVTVDLREKWWAINDQAQTGSCVGWATTDGLLRWHFVKKGKIKPGELLSVRFVWMSAKETDEFTTAPSTFIEEAGTSLKSALDVARNYGCVPETILPFGSGKLFPGKENDFYSLASRYKIASYFNLLKQNEDPIKTWKQWLADNNGPILVRLDVDDTWQNAGNTNGEMDVYNAQTTTGGHAVCIVGYTKDRIIIRNSWGKTNWGKDGFGLASYDYARAAFTEAYGVSVP